MSIVSHRIWYQKKVRRENRAWEGRFYTIYNGFFRKYACSDVPFSEVVEALKRYRTQFQSLLKEQDARGDDFRTGAETYGYSSEESIRENMRYISDRFNCQFRLRWLLGVLDEGVLNQLPVRDEAQ